jgi:hypothetical protein
VTELPSTFRRWRTARSRWSRSRKCSGWWKAGLNKKRIAAQTTVDVKTVRRYIAVAEDCGLVPGPEPPLDDEQVAAVVAALAPDTGRPHGDSWQQCEAERDAVAKLLTDGVRLSKVHRLLHRRV